MYLDVFGNRPCFAFLSGFHKQGNILTTRHNVHTTIFTRSCACDKNPQSTNSK